jgi:formamidopyrimidine-DNA glycosylase
VPEGPETEVVRRTLAPLLSGRVVTDTFSSELGLRGVPMRRRALKPLVGARLGSVDRVGKRLGLQLTLAGGEQRRLLVQLGMTGRLVVQPRDGERPPHTHVVLGLGDDVLLYADARRFGTVALDDEARWPPDDLGPDLLTLHQKAPRAAARAALARTRRSLKDALLDQRVIAGVGNIYACEALFVAGIDPRTTGVDAGDRLDDLLTAVREEGRRGVGHGGTSFKDFVDGRGRRGRHQDHLRVFLREGQPCPGCQTPIERLIVGQRSTFFCPRCQI